MDNTNAFSYKGKLMEGPLSIEQKEYDIAGRTVKIFPPDKMDKIPLTVLHMAPKTVCSDKDKCYQTEIGFKVEEENEDFLILNQNDAIPKTIDAWDEDHHSGKMKGFKYSVGEKIIESKQEHWVSDHVLEDLDGADLGINLRNTDTVLECTRQSSVIDLKEERRKKEPKVFFEDFVDKRQEDEQILNETTIALKLHDKQCIAEEYFESVDQPQVQNEEICIKQSLDLNEEYLANLAISQIKGDIIKQETGNHDKVLVDNHKMPNEGDFVSLKSKRAKGPREIREIGKGAFGKCFQVEFSSKYGGTVNVAIKKIESKRKHNQEVEEMRKEFRMLRRLNHLNIVRCYWDNFDDGQGKYSIAMEYMSGGTISHYLHHRKGGLPEDYIKHYLVQILDGMEYLHSVNILHRDLKGENLLLSEDLYDLKICDFGCATEVKDIVNGYKDKQLVGTVPFMPPEVIREQLYSAASDVWAVGCCIIQMTTGKLPWNASGNKNEELSLMFKIGKAENPPPIPKYLSSSLYALTRSCLQIDKQKRPSVKELLTNQIFDDF
ncbi:mitogen-activated protein kinase kinase kinase 1-like [Ruditapes philippinarum]|uniref:mitogen-activated protein kinase kinase kinase 1-like n=1 Tax=Ruditapes philippinarum TaxID=129788 RepID=UPI00295B22D0|nr:mitogen-activated protein kinase kinase kinase 1-like [Ruditapes philippinarum]